MLIQPPHSNSRKALARRPLGTGRYGSRLTAPAYSQYICTVPR